MTIEIERRFLVRHPETFSFGYDVVECVQIRQGYFGHVNGLKLRVRIMCDAQGNSTAVLTRKSPRRGICREEYENPLALDEAENALASLLPSKIIRKRRHLLRHRDGLSWSVDCFEGQNAGLVIAEIELMHLGQRFERPSWAGKEVTLDRRYGNSALARSPIGDNRNCDITASNSLPRLMV